MSCLWALCNTSAAQEPIQYKLVHNITPDEKNCVQLNGMASCLICKTSFQTSNTVIQCTVCQRYIGHASCYTHSWPTIKLPHCPECGATAV